jgi:dephospho-CoA kinase
VLRVGLTGGIGSGKSAVSSRLVNRGAVLIDADVAARDVVDVGTPGLAAIVEAFGDAVLRADGSLDREGLGRIVFNDPGARGRLNAIVHPLVGARMREMEAGAAAGAVVVYDIPLLVENRLKAAYDVVVVVDVAPDVQLNRLVRLRGMSESDARSRIAAQATREQRRAAADIVIENSGGLDDLDRQVDALWADLAARLDAQANPRP